MKRCLGRTSFMRGLREVLALSLVLCLPLCQAQQQTASPLTPHAEQIREKVASLKNGARLTVVGIDNAKSHGSLSSSNGKGFVLDEVDLKQQVTFSYEDVKKVQRGYGGMNRATGRRVDPVRGAVITAAIVGGTIALLVALLAGK